ncbi:MULTISPECIES: TadE/TadG family type IV pilus assembly protein [unclassified Mesorhizobium]|uniref:TadE/TadG family type IV pilus assembly protein n=2 Tax=unclassified Mesorhizobium TaxID=325217 RepID=UPI003100BA26
MLMGAGAHSVLARLCRKAAGLYADRRGLAAVEFALIAPLLLSMYFVTMEVSQGIEANKKIGRIGSMVADLVTQQTSVTKSALESIMQIGQSSIQPYNRSKPTIIVTAIEITDEDSPKVQVAWSRQMIDGAFSEPYPPKPTKQETTVPAELKIRNTFLIRVESDLAYLPLIAWTAAQKPVLGLAAAFDGISMSETYYLRPRITKTITCTDC